MFHTTHTDDTTKYTKVENNGFTAKEQRKTHTGKFAVCGMELHLCGMDFSKKHVLYHSYHSYHMFLKVFKKKAYSKPA
jgi:hypothetical protein